MSRWLVLLLALVALWWWLLPPDPINHPAGRLVQTAPIQRLVDEQPVQAYEGFQLKPRAEFSLQARVLGTERYRFGREADLAPVDLALGWGPMSDSAVLDQLKITQSNRFYYWSTPQFPVPRAEIESHSGNMHIIPADGYIEDQLGDLRPGHLVSLRGKLVDASATDGWFWNTSLSRTDTGNGACELFLVEFLSIKPPD